jgi:NHLM bacteriocin system ABC transporter ATP-binding protein
MDAMKYSIQNSVFDRLFNLPESFFRNYDSAGLAGRAIGASSIFEGLSELLVTQGLSAVFSLFYLFRMFTYSFNLSILSIFMLIISMLIIWIFGQRELKYKKITLELNGKTNSKMFQILTGISKLRIAGVENRALYEYLKPYTEAREAESKYSSISAHINEVIIAALPAVYSLFFYMLVVYQGISMSIGEFIGFISAFGAFSAAMLSLIQGLLTANEINPTFERLRPILETKPEFEDDMVLPGDITGDIEMNNITFAYDQEVGNVIDNLSLHIKPGEYVGIVGSSGCGKSTLLKLLLGFEKPQRGKIYYDGRDIDATDKRELRKKLGVVLQNGGIIAGSIYENITITCPDAKISRVNKVIEDVGLKEDIEQMPMGMHTYLSEGSGSISGGQKQRILIARALVSNPKIIFFDEATSALDNVTQSMICKTLENIDATKVVIAHRLSTIINCDRIIVLDGGRIVEDGNYEALMAKKGLFYELASRQIE